MKITEIVVEVHEKRAHPHAMGHKDASITLVATIDADDDPALMAEVLQAKAEAHVNKHLDEWIAGIEREVRYRQIQNDCARVGYSRDYEELFRKTGEVLASIQRDDYDRKLKMKLSSLLACQIGEALVRIKANAKERGAIDDADTEIPF